MIKKKLLYFTLITIILLSPIMYWMNAWWGVKFIPIPSFGAIQYVLTRDRFLLSVVGINTGLYFVAIFKIFTMKAKDDNYNQNKNTVSNNGNKPVFLNNTSESDISKWENLYGNKNTNVDTVQKTETLTQNNISTNEGTPVSKDDVIKKEEIKIETNQVEKKNESSVATDDNIVDIADTVSARDVYRNMISDIFLDNGYENIGPQTIANTDVDFVSIAESDTLVLGIINIESGDIIANEISNSGNDAPSWFTNEHKFISPVWEIKNVANIVQNMINEVLPEDNGIIIKPVVVIPNAVVSNFSDIQAKWQEIGVDVVRFMNHSNLPNLTDVLPDKTDTEVLESYKNFVNTLMKYFAQKARKYPTKKVG